MFCDGIKKIRQSHSKSPQEVAAEIDAEEATEKEQNALVPDVNIFSDEMHPEFGELRTITIDGQPWFVGKDVAVALGYKNISDAIKKHVDNEDKGIANCDTPGGRQKIITINESGLYSLIISSKLPSAKDFKHWVTSEVLPTIRKNFFYLCFELFCFWLTGKHQYFIKTIFR